MSAYFPSFISPSVYYQSPATHTSYKIPKMLFCLFTLLYALGFNYYSLFKAFPSSSGQPTQRLLQTSFAALRPVLCDALVTFLSPYVDKTV